MPRTGNRGPGTQGQKHIHTSSKPPASQRKSQQKAVTHAIQKQPSPSGLQAERHTEMRDQMLQNTKKVDIEEKSVRQQPSKLNSLLRSSDYDPHEQQGKLQEWKLAVHRYISLYNQAEANQHATVLTDYVTDRDHCDRLRCRLERLRERDLLRGALPAGSETKAELIRVNESSSEVSVLIRLHIKRRMEQSGRFYMEERSEFERLWLGFSGHSWNVLRVEPIIAERRPRYGTAVDNWMTVDDYSELFDEQSSPSTPYLNYDLLQQFKHRPSGIRYRRDLVAAYADRWWNEGNPAYELFEVNCTNYVSQCIFAGNAPMNYTGKRETGWWYKGRNKGSEWWSYSWAVSNAITNYLTASKTSGLRAEVVQSADELQLGDVITYDWNGDHRFQHSTIVTAFDSFGMPLVNANTVSSRHRYWDYRDSYAWTEQTKYRFFHIADQL
ncbi:amidase domain-containing protein [Bacillus sp. FJAT-28004]|uniref:amidase domain-containing protein n=1 Tax=Bacillus sp. FJAT-28004 TaxID=1679165 RepID=UPI000B03CBA4|nr:amidase domain-containing protein [Bacillus sp. FJAT-28004]